MGLIFDLDCPTTMLVTTQSVRERKPRPRIEADTPIVPRAIAESVWEEAGAWLGEELPRRWVWRLTARANAVYARNPRFRKTLLRSGNVGRDWLWTFARHWLAAMIWKHRRELYSRLPGDYSVGHDLPDRPPTD